MRFGFSSRPLGSWEALRDKLEGIGGAENAPGGGVRMPVKFSSEKRTGYVTVRYADVAGIGPVAYLQAPIGTASPAAVRAVLEHAVRLVTGGIVIDEGMLALRAALPIATATYAHIAREAPRIAIAADEFAKMLEAHTHQASKT